MKWMIASDLHGSAHYTQALLDRFAQSDAPRLLLLGDLLYHGPRNNLPRGYHPQKVIALLSSCRERLLCVRGNCDAAVDQMVLPFPILADYAVLQHGERLVYATHGDTYGPDNPPPLCKGDALLFGHTHVPLAQSQPDRLLLNPGSVSLPKNDFPPSYATLENGVFTVYALDANSVLLSVAL